MKFVHSKNEVYKPILSLKKYNDTLYDLTFLKCCRQPGFEEHRPHKEADKPQKISSDDDIQRISLSRAKSRVRELISLNQFEYFFTATISPNSPIIKDRYDIDVVAKKIQDKFKNLSRKCNELKYLYVFEKHIDGAIHLHGVLSIDEKEIYINKNGYYSLRFFDNIGFTSLSKIKNINACANYCTKYITKQCVRSSKGSYYYRSRNLINEPQEIRLNTSIAKDLENFVVFRNDFCKKYSKLAIDFLRDNDII